MSDNREKHASVPLFYLKSRALLLLLFVVCVALFAVVLLLRQVPHEAAWYAGALCLLPITAALVVDYARFAARHKALDDLLSGLPESLVHLPAPRGLIARDYQALLKQLLTLHTARVSADDLRYQQMQEYYTLWSHQIKTPLAAMRLLLSQEDSQRSRLLLSELQKTEHYADMALHFMRLDGPGSDFHFAKAPLRKLASAAARRFATPFVLKQLSLTIDIPEDTQVLTDSKWLTFVLEQLISNAVKYTKEGGITITWDEEKHELTVADTGVGIRAEDLPRVFERGFTGVLGREDLQATGIGLFLSREICKRLSHGLRLESAVGVGTRAILRFPPSNALIE